MTLYETIGWVIHSWYLISGYSIVFIAPIRLALMYFCWYWWVWDHIGSVLLIVHTYVAQLCIVWVCLPGILALCIFILNLFWCGHVNLYMPGRSWHYQRSMCVVCEHCLLSVYKRLELGFGIAAPVQYRFLQTFFTFNYLFIFFEIFVIRIIIIRNSH